MGFPHTPFLTFIADLAALSTAPAFLVDRNDPIGYNEKKPMKGAKPMIQGEERQFKKGQIILKEKSFELAIYNILLGRAGVYVNYGTPEERLVVEIEAGDFLNVISFLESRPRNTTAVALEPTVVRVITHDNFSTFFRDNSAKIMSLLEHMSARMRALQRAYIRACHALEKYADTDKIKQDNSEWYAEHSHTYQFWANMFFSDLEHNKK